MHRNLEVPLQEIMALATNEFSEQAVELRAGLRTGDTTASRRSALIRRPPHILVTTPESLYLMLTSERSRQTLRTVETLIVDEIHALVRDKRGSHLSLSMERLEELVDSPLQRIGLSATQKPIERMFHFLVGDRLELPPTSQPHPLEVAQPELAPAESAPNCDSSQNRTSDPDLTLGQVASSVNSNIIDVGHLRKLDLAIEVPPSELSTVCTHEQWAEIHERIVELVNEHRSTLIFVNTRRLAERVTHQLSELLGEDQVGSHHGSLSSEIRLTTERRLKSGDLKAVVATASLELGLDVGYIDLVIQIGSPRSIATLLQRIGRSGHSLGVVPKGRLFALTRDELLECMALTLAIRNRRLDSIVIPEAPLDVLAQQIVSEVSAEEWGTDELFALCRRSYSYRNLTRLDFDRTVEFLSEGISKSTGRSRVYLHHDQVQRRLRARKGARIAATTNGGAIAEVASFRVVTEPEKTVVGTVDEDFAIESTAGSVFLLGNTSWRIRHVRGGDVTVTDAHGAPPTIPFWRGEAPGRTIELSAEIAKLREELENRLEDPTTAEEWLVKHTSCSRFAAEQAVVYVAAQKAAIGLVPTQRRVVFERFFDESGGMQLVVHAPFGSRINQAWGFAMRKRFCRSFDFELQATADDNGFILSLGPQHSFPLESMFPILTKQNARSLLEQAVLAVPMFQIRWRWNVTRALLVARRQNGKRVPPALQRFRADDLLTAVFPKLTGCQENVVGDIELPDQPLVTQTMHDCLHEALDITGLEHVLGQIEEGEIELVARDTREPSPFSYGLLNSSPYAFLDGGEIQERRTRAVSSRRSLTVESVSDLGRLDPLAIAQVREEAQPPIRSADELHDVLLSRIILPTSELPLLSGSAESDDSQLLATWYNELADQKRATTFRDSKAHAGRALTAWVAAERLPAAQAVFPEATVEPSIDVPESVRQDWDHIEARVAIVRGLIEISGPINATEMAERVSITISQAAAALEALEGEGAVLRGRFTPDCKETNEDAEESTEYSEDSAGILETEREIEWCHRRLLARIHRLTLEGLRKQIEPVEVETYYRFLTHHHGLVVSERRAGANGVFEVISMLQGIDVPVVCWETDVLPARVSAYQAQWLDELCLTGEVGWGRLFPPKRSPDQGRPMANLTRVAPISIFLRSDLDWLTHVEANIDVASLSGSAQDVLELLNLQGAKFATDITRESRIPPLHLDDILGELVTRGLVTSDGFGGVRQLIARKAGSSRRGAAARRRGLRQRATAATSGRWSTWRRAASSDENQQSNEQKQSAQNPTSHTVQAVLTEAPEPITQASIIEQWAWQLLRRWGVVFRELLAREAGAPTWFELLQVYRRLEARGEIRGGRFITGVGGEQYGLGEIIRKLRRLRDDEQQPELVVISAADPLNLVGILDDQPRIPSTANNRVAYLNGVPVAALQSGKLIEFEGLPSDMRAQVIRQIDPFSPLELSESLSENNVGTGSTNGSEENSGENKDDSKKKKKNSTRPRFPNSIPRPMIS